MIVGKWFDTSSWSKSDSLLERATPKAWTIHLTSLVHIHVFRSQWEPLQVEPSWFMSVYIAGGSPFDQRPLRSMNADFAKREAINLFRAWLDELRNALPKSE